jgi:hypothetical protein
MNDRIKEFAVQAGYLPDMFNRGHWDMPECHKFAELVRQDERELCAKLCEDLEDETVDTCVGWQYAEAIRGRTE